MVNQALMQQPVEASNRLRGLKFYWPWCGLVLVLLLVGFVRYRLLDMPLERDEGEYAYAGQLIQEGIPPYELAYNMKLPGTYYVFALGMAVFGQTTAGIHTTLLFANSLTILFVFLLGRRLLGDAAAVAVAASYGVMSISPWVLGMAAHANHFVVLFAVPASLLLWDASAKRRDGLLFVSGLLYGLAFLMKQQGMFFAIFGGIFLIVNTWTQSSVKNLLKKLTIYSTGVILPFACLCLLMWSYGEFGHFWFWTFTYARSYVAITTWQFGWQRLLEHLSGTCRLSVGIWVTAIGGTLLGLAHKGLRKETLFIAGLWIFALFGAAMGLYFRSHYFILLLPAISLMIGLFTAGFPHFTATRIKKASGQGIALVIVGMAIGWNVFYQKDFFFRLSGDELIRAIYPNHPFLEAAAVANYIRLNSNEKDLVAVVGSEPEIYYYAHRHSASGYIYTYPLVEPQPHAVFMQQDMIHDIETAKPEYLVWVGFDTSWLLRPNSDLTIFQWFGQYVKDNYNFAGEVETTQDGQTTSQFGPEAQPDARTNVQYITVYHRRPAPSER